MKVPLSWLRDFVEVELEVDELARVFDDLGLVVEGVQRFGEGLDGVVVARVSEITAIEGADRIRRVVVDAGDGEVEVVCGAWNFSEGDLVPLARVGAVLPGGFEISQRKMRGVLSNGMLCSGRELALSEDGEGILVLGEGAVVGTPLAEALGIAPDVVFDLAVEGNRPDALSIAGVARDLAARLGLDWSVPPLPAPLGDVAEASAEEGCLVKEGGETDVTIRVECPQLCDRFGAWVISGVAVAASPAWMQRRLSMAGMRPINNVVDVSNYLMVEIGQPNHPYDLARLSGRGLVVRVAEPGEKLVTLDGVERTLGLGYDSRPGPADCVIADAEGKVVGIAGVIGGASSEIAEGTCEVLLEVAHFDPMAVARTSRRLRIRTEAALRFERGCDPAAIETTGERFVRLLAAISPKGSRLSVTQVSTALGERPSPRRVLIRVPRVNAILGTDLKAEEVSAHLRSLGFVVDEDGADGGRGGSGQVGDSGEVLVVEVPTFRPDCEREIDLIEEVARIHGYSRIPRRALLVPRAGGLTAYQRERRKVRQVAALALGATEAWTPSFLAPGDHHRAGLAEPEVVVANPVAREESVLRSSLLPGLLAALSRNVSHRNADVILFEVGHVFERAKGSSPAVPDEREVLAVMCADASGSREGVMAAVRAWRVLEDALGLRGVEIRQEPVGGLHPGRAGRLISRGDEVGVLGEVHPAVAEAFGLPGRRIGWLEVALGWESSGGRSSEEGIGILSSVPRRPPEVREPSPYPSADLDLAFAVPEDVPAESVRRSIENALGSAGEWVVLFDVYRGAEIQPGSRSLAFRARVALPDRTLTDADLADLRARAIDAVERETRGRLRS